VRFSVSHTFKMAAVTSLYATYCCHLLSKHGAFVGAYAAASISSNSICHSVRLSHWFNKVYLLACLLVRPIVITVAYVYFRWTVKVIVFIYKKAVLSQRWPCDACMHEALRARVA